MNIEQEWWMKTPDYKLEFSHDTYSYYSVKGIYSEGLMAIIYFKRKTKHGQVMKQITVEEYNSAMREYVEAKQFFNKQGKWRLD